MLHCIQNGPSQSQPGLQIWRDARFPRELPWFPALFYFVPGEARSSTAAVGFGLPGLGLAVLAFASTIGEKQWLSELGRLCRLLSLFFFPFLSYGFDSCRAKVHGWVENQLTCKRYQFFHSNTWLVHHHLITLDAKRITEPDHSRFCIMRKYHRYLLSALSLPAAIKGKKNPET